MNLSSAAIGNYERGAREPGIRELIILAEFFNASMDYFVGRIEKNTKQQIKIIYYAIVETLNFPCSLKTREIDMIIHVLVNGKECFWDDALT